MLDRNSSSGSNVVTKHVNMKLTFFNFAQIFFFFLSFQRRLLGLDPKMGPALGPEMDSS